MTLPRLTELTDQWEFSPPLHRMIRVIAETLGVEFKSAPSPAGSSGEPQQEQDLMSLFNFPGIING